ncbi:MAG: heptaprenylglyceryl phosphate synthase [Halosimplex sp.]
MSSELARAVAMSVSRTLQTFFSAVRTGATTFLSETSNPVPRDWRHVTKIDPEAEKRLPVCFPFYLQHTDAIAVGGSSDVTARNTEETFSLLAVAETPAFHEPSETRHVTERTRELATFLAIPEVLNGEPSALVGTLGEGIEYLNDELLPELLESKLPSPVYSVLGDSLVDFATSWLLDRAVFEAYIVQNPESAAARRSGVTEDDVLSPAVARQRAMVADRHLKSELVYIEYSGTYGGEEAVRVLQSVSESLTRARLWYGGGIDGREKSSEILAAGADTVVVGDVFHDIADEEVRILEQASTDLDRGASPSEIRRWIRSEIDIPSTVAFRYLRTIPGVRSPESTTERYLSLTVGLLFAARASESGPRRDSVGRSAELLEALFPDGNRQIENAFADHESVWRRYVAEFVVPAATPADTEAPVHHLSVAELSPDR